MTVAVLCGGVGAARFLSGLVRSVPPEDVTAIVNVGDDATFHGLHVSPDIDTVLYTLAGIADETHGWGIRGDTYAANDALRRLGAETWFRIGDADLATHLRRTERLRAGAPLSRVTDELRRALGVRALVRPVTDDAQRTEVRTAAGWLEFQEYFVRRGFADDVLEVRCGAAARPAPGVLEAIRGAEVVLVAPSNPFVSIGPILAVQGVRDTLAAARRVVAVTPIVGGAALKGPAADMLRTLGHEVSARGVARLYADFLDAMVVDERDAALADGIAALGVRPVLADTVMRDGAARERLARAALDAARAAV